MITLIKSFLNKQVVINSIPRQTILFVISGLICYIADLSILILLKEFLHLGLYPSISIAFFFATLLSYFLNRTFIFQYGKYKTVFELFLFVIIAIVTYFLTIGFLYLLVDLLLFNYILAKTLTVVIIAFLNFILRKSVVFLK